LGLYRLAGATDNNYPYVYTNPDHDIIVTHRDKVFVLGLAIPDHLKGEEFWDSSSNQGSNEDEKETSEIFRKESGVVQVEQPASLLQQFSFQHKDKQDNDRLKNPYESKRSMVSKNQDFDNQSKLDKSFNKGQNFQVLNVDDHEELILGMRAKN